MFLKANKYPTPKLTLSQHKSSMKTQANNRTNRTLRPHANKTIDDPDRFNHCSTAEQYGEPVIQFVIIVVAYRAATDNWIKRSLIMVGP